MSPEASFFFTVLDKYGWLGAGVILIAITLRKIGLFLKPYVVDLIQAQTDRHKSMAEDNTRLTTKCIEIQESSLRAWGALDKRLDGLCRHTGTICHSTNPPVNTPQ